MFFQSLTSEMLYFFFLLTRYKKVGGDPNLFLFGHVRFITEASQIFVNAFAIKWKHVQDSVWSIVQLAETIENHEVAV